MKAIDESRAREIAEEYAIRVCAGYTSLAVDDALDDLCYSTAGTFTGLGDFHARSRAVINEALESINDKVLELSGRAFDKAHRVARKAIREGKNPWFAVEALDRAH